MFFPSRRWISLGMVGAAFLTVGSLGLPRQADADLERIREKALELEQSLNKERFETDVLGNQPNSLRTYKDFAFLLKKSKVEEAEKETGDPQGPRLRLFLIQAAVGLELASYEDDLRAFETGGTAEMDGRQIGYSQLISMLATSDDPAERRKAYSALKGVVETANVFRNQIVQRRVETYQAWGYPDMASFYAEREGVDLDVVSGEAVAFLEKTKDLYDRLFEETSLSLLEVESRKVKFGDIPYLMRGARFEDALPAAQRGDRIATLFEGLGISSGDNLTVDKRTREGRALKAGVYALSVPDDVRVGFVPRGGVNDDHLLANVTARAKIYTLSGQTGFEQAYLVPQAPQWALAYLVEDILDDDVFLAAHSSLSGDELQTYRRFRAFSTLYEARFLAGLVQYEIALYRGQEAPEDVFRTVMRDAIGIRLSSTDVARSLEFANELGSVGRFQGLMLSAGLRAHMQKTHGKDWFEGGKSGPELRAFWKKGGTLTIEDLAAVGGDVDAGIQAFLTDIQGMTAQ